MKRQQIAEKYDVTLDEMNKYFKLLGIKSKPKKPMKYTVTDDTKAEQLAVQA